MGWRKTCSVTERMKFVLEYFGEEPASMAELCRKYGISRKTGYKWIARWEPDDPGSLSDRSGRPRSHPQATPEWVVNGIVEARKARPHWGPKKLRVVLERSNPGVPLPSVATFANIIKRHGLVRPRRRHRKMPPLSAPFSDCNGPNDLWCADFKGHFRTGRSRCYPLTISDAYSRYLLRCDSMTRPRHREVNRVFESAFREFGLPTSIRTDNGPPFASASVGGLWRLSVWWMRLGIRVERIEPGKPQQNGRHERMHRTLKQEAANPPSSSIRQQQQRFDLFRRDYNDERPHEALHQTVPASYYQPSQRPYPRHLPSVEYPLTFYTFRVPDNGVLPWRGTNVYISNCLANQYIGLSQTDDDRWDVYYCSMHLGSIRLDNSHKRKHYQFIRCKRVLPMSFE